MLDDDLNVKQLLGLDATPAPKKPSSKKIMPNTFALVLDQKSREREPPVAPEQWWRPQTFEGPSLLNGAVDTTTANALSEGLIAAAKRSDAMAAVMPDEDTGFKTIAAGSSIIPPASLDLTAVDHGAHQSRVVNGILEAGCAKLRAAEQQQEKQRHDEYRNALSADQKKSESEFIEHVNKAAMESGRDRRGNQSARRVHATRLRYVISRRWRGDPGSRSNGEERTHHAIEERTHHAIEPS